jgi:RNA-binding protein
LGHHLNPVVQIGKLGLTSGVTDAVLNALAEHELVKVRIGTECPEDRHELAERLGPLLGAEVVQVLGRTVLFYQRRAKDPTIQLPKDSPPGGSSTKPS